MLYIKQLRIQKGLTQDQLSKQAGIPKRTFVDYENEKGDIPLSKLQDIARALKVPVSQLLSSEAEIEPNIATEPHIPYFVTIDKTNKENIVMIPVSARAGYLSNFDDEEYISKLPSYSLPQIQNGTFRMFQVAGHSMVPTIHDKAYVVGQFVENWQRDIKDNRIYIIISQNEGIIIKRCLNRLEKYGSLYCKSDNRAEHPNITVELEEIREVWEVKMLLSWDLPDPADLYDRLNDLEAEVMFLKSSKP